MQKISTRERIIERARQLIREKGYQHLPLRQLTSQLGVTTGAFYKAFKNKEELYYQICITEAQKQDNDWATIYLDKITSPLDGIWYIGLFLLSEYELNTHMMEFLFFSPIAVESYKRGELLSLGNRTVAYLHELLDNNKENLDHLLVQLNAFIIGYGHLIANGLETFNEDIYRSAFNRILTDYISR